MILYLFDIFFVFPARRTISLTVCVCPAYDEGGEAKRGVAAMAQEIYVSRHDGISMCSLEGKQLRSAALEQAGVLCVGKKHLYCARDDGREIVRFDLQTLTKQAVLGGGTGISQLMLSADGERLYALCSDADSVLMLDALSGMPMIVCCVGCNPQQMTLCSDMLAVAGGESGCVYLLNAHSLEVCMCLSMPGPVYGVALCGHAVHAICMTQTLDTLLVTDSPAGRVQLVLSGMPGRMLLAKDELLISSHGWLHAVSRDGKRLLWKRAAPGRASALLAADGQVLYRDMLSERLFMSGGGGMWKLLSIGAMSVAVI